MQLSSDRKYTDDDNEITIVALWFTFPTGVGHQ